MNLFLQPSIKNYLIEALQTNLTSNPANEYYNTLKDYYVISEAEEGRTNTQLYLPTPESYELDQKMLRQRNPLQLNGQQSPGTTTQPKPKKQKKVTEKDVAGGGSGTGSRKGIDDKNDNKSLGGILFNDQKGTDIPAAIGLYGAGKIADTAADAIDAFGGQAVGDTLSKFIPAGLGNVPVVGAFAKSAASKLFSGIPGAASKVLRQVSDISGANMFDVNIANIGNSANELAAQGAGSPWTKLLVPKTSKNPLTPYDPFKERKQKVADAQFAAKEAKLKKQGLIP